MEPDFQWDDKYRISYKDTEKWKKYLKQNGFVVLANYMQQEQCQKYVDMSWAIMQKLSQGKLDKNKKQTHLEDQNYPILLHGGMIQYIGHSQMQWDLRKRCKPIFEEIWNTKDLKSSFDGMCFMNGARKFPFTAQNSSLHSDQAPNKNYLWSYQGIMTLTSAGPEGGGFVCVPKSHLYHHAYFEKKGMLSDKKNWHLIPQKDKLAQPLCNYQKVNTEAGDFILFDSRTFHCNTVPRIDSLRICTYICMIPKDKVPQMILQERKNAFKQKRTTAHHPGSGFRMFPIMPRFVQDPDKFLEIINQINQPQLDKQMKSLI